MPQIRILAQNAMLERAQALAKIYGADPIDLHSHILDLLHRFGNEALMDTCQRVGGDPGRKLSPEDRLIGASRQALKAGITPAYIALGAAAGLHRYIQEAGMQQTDERAYQVLAEVSGLEKEELLTKMILAYYDKICSGSTLAQLQAFADQVKHESIGSVV